MNLLTKHKFRTPGLRNIKTALSVLLCAVFFNTINYIFDIDVTYFYAAITAVFTLQQTDELTKERAYDRNLGTIIGAVVAIIIGFIRLNFFTEYFDSIFLFFGIIAVIWLVNFFELKAGVMIGCIMLIASFNDPQEFYIAYSVVRVLETIIGALIAVLVNKYIFPLKNKRGYYEH